MRYVSGKEMALWYGEKLSCRVLLQRCCRSTSFVARSKIDSAARNENARVQARDPTIDYRCERAAECSKTTTKNLFNPFRVRARAPVWMCVCV